MQRFDLQRLKDSFQRKRSTEHDGSGSRSRKSIVGGLSQDGPTPENLTMFQAFEWYVPADQKHWQRLLSTLPRLKEIGISNMWIPPGCKATSPQDNGYGVYDLYDLGEFHQKGSRPTKWGSKEDLLNLLARAQQLGVGIYWDTILNHKASADCKERCMAVKVDPDDRTQEIGPPEEIEAWIGFDFPDRGSRYSSQKYHWYHFNGTDYNSLDHSSAIYRLEGKKWSEFVDKEHKNYDYLMFSNLDHTHDEVREDIKRWGEWLGHELKLKGLRLDAVKHYSDRFQLEFIEHLERTVGSGWFFVAEYWLFSVKGMREYLSRMKHKVSLFDSTLLYNFAQVSKTRNADLRKIFEGSLVQVEPHHAVTLVMNHDTQPTQPLAAPFGVWFKPLAYALILLREDGYPCVFYGDLYGIASNSPHHPKYEAPSCRGRLPHLCLARKLYAYGPQINYFEAPSCIGFTRLGTWDRPNGLACVMASTSLGKRRMFVGREHAGETWTDILGLGMNRRQGVEKNVIIDGKGNGDFTCDPMSVAVWVRMDAPDREKFDVPL
ncbi:hypothetical protein MMC32_001409 [Xylographa parallela]|nr:hypothetical protein [Xylographa parallela]